ncbi:hypothetical protein B0T26DRAFT_448779 [Lasiosphaeria miniovina]|uniref:Mid2 domain-containing protein n=1 Tax=Lasiosphaeria miniovina TaxID=1954250 RepID=A0AA39ZZ68_9PEZI|nr:uncharacterized protein B0T26DRAFT_448779 [Lasiosphaeria miniovina]KAK0706348.1 hypothetical protein B0T26DRAFT_448779 [Lasiosphaeria miniovina]
MRRASTCAPGLVLLVSALLGGEAAASHAGRQRHDALLHRVAKAQVTAHPLRRDTSTCQADYSLCAQTLGGGCCPPRYSCATDSCYATTAGPTSACGKAGYFNCAASDSGGCCPVGYICGTNDCTPPVGITNTYTSCPNNYFLCPASMSFGCCQSGMGCAQSACYSTNPVTSTVTQAVTTTSGTHRITTTETSVVVATPSPPSGLPSDTNIAAAKFIPTSVPKSSAIVTPDSGGGGGLSPGALGGIIAGVVVLLIVVVVAAFLIIRRLKGVQNVMESKKGSSSGHQTKSQSQAQMAYYGRQLHAAPSDDMSIDPLIKTPVSGSATPHVGTRGRSDSDRTPSQNDMMSSRHASPDSNGGYFDLPARVHNIPGAQNNMSTAAIRGSIDSQSTQGQNGHHHWRQQSNASELSADGSEHSAGANSPLVVPELDTSGTYAELPSAGSGGSRNRSGSGAGSSPRVTFGHVRQGSVTTGFGAGGQLGVVSESAEMHGYYGPSDRQAGQTSAGLEDGERGMNSPTLPRAPVPRPPPPDSQS